MRSILRLWLVYAGLATSVLLAGCDDFDQTLQSVGGGNASSTDRGRRPDTQADPATFKSNDAVSIASFNIQVFGSSKMNKPSVMDVLARVVRRFDVVAIQEIRSKDQTIVPRFIELINATGARYDYVIGPRLGRTSSKEQYAFLFDTKRIEVLRDSVYTVGDREDRLHREPLVARFRVRSQPSGRAFTFTLVNIHTDPDETDTELDALDDVFQAVQQGRSGEDDVILLGDLNVDENHLGELGRLPNIVWAISGRKTNTRRTKAYDNIIFDKRATVEYHGRSGVFDLPGEFGLSQDEALRVSDHLPVWAVFSAYEGTRSPLAENRRDQRQ
jgi:endonuclease/exonuclease/phosphatase family metal-dependent hydrolase